MGYLFLGVAILAEVIATSALKYSEGFTRPLPSLVVALGYGGGVLLPVAGAQNSADGRGLRHMVRWASC